MNNKEVQQDSQQQEKKETNADLLQWWWQSPKQQYQDYLNFYSKMNNFYRKNPSVFDDYEKFKEKFNYNTSKISYQNVMDYFYNKYQSDKAPAVTQNSATRTAEQNNKSLNLDIF